MSAAQPRSVHIDPVEHNTPDETPGTTDPDAEATAFANAINKIFKENYSHFNPKYQEPDPLWFQLSQTLHFYPPVKTQLLRLSRSISG